ncbi:6-carboxytetrahydropterin synthase [Fluviispira sanaruensis]|uniref:6-carboxy-5,6,7,8-tetrahydropterin synthase n=1 Tax=Fluviispira sanaruensis TaxID=2493639 RepID=A0A4P2VGI4_FLUSA|nr:6-carboxytetrahydropterin synthase [Fluviispira sanaruensis]BBH51983.1 6-pyruvoyltetrahydropterin synthase [Fluviispira sanaruensis]
MQIKNRNLTKIFIQNVTLLDCALFIPEKGPKGKSWYVDIVWEGEKDATGVLFDFSLAKKSAKSTIDHEFDHKLLVTASHIRFQSNSQIIVIGNNKSDTKESLFAINTYNNSVKKIARETLKALESDDVSELEKEIANAILRNSPSNVKNVKVTLREDEKKKKENYFNYTHSLCHHYGNCQRFHGHSNIIEIFHKGKFDLARSAKAAKKLNNSYIISRNYLAEKWDSRLITELVEHCPEISDFKSELIAAQYKGTQGEVAVIMPKINTLALDCESTVENLAEYIRNQFVDDTDIEVRAYEGLAKGSICI